MKHNSILIIFFSLCIAFVTNSALATEKIKSLTDLYCATNEIAKFDGTTWVCSLDVDTNNNAETDCLDNEVLLGDGSCADISEVPAFRRDYFSIPAEAFVSAGGNITNTSKGTGGAWVIDPAFIPTYMVAPVHLPHGAMITHFTMNFVDNSNADLEYMQLLVRPHNSSGSTALATFSSSGFSGDSQTVDSLTTTTIINHPVNNDGNSYFVRIFANWPGTEHLRIISAVVEYTIGVAP